MESVTKALHLMASEVPKVSVSREKTENYVNSARGNYSMLLTLKKQSSIDELLMKIYPDQTNNCK